MVGSCEEIPAGYSVPGDVVASDFTSWGPADDGRIKPDIVADGDWLYSTDDDNDNDYQWLGGTSMSTPAASGSAALDPNDPMLVNDLDMRIEDTSRTIYYP